MDAAGLFSIAQANLHESLSSLQKEKESFENDIRELKDFKEKMTSVHAGRSSKVRLDVGGCIFATSTSTLQTEQSLLSAMFSGNFDLQKDVDNCYFIDRNPQYFR